MRRPIGGLFVLWMVLVAVSSCARQPAEWATLRGQVSIGPLVPVVREGEPEPTAAPEVYAARQIVVYKVDGQTEMIRAEIDSTGAYNVTLPVGSYVVDINRIGIDSAAGLPVQIELRAGEVLTLDIEIDTGIR